MSGVLSGILNGVRQRFLLLGMVVFVFTGCKDPEGIEQRVPPKVDEKPYAEPDVEKKERIIGLIMPQGTLPGWWFFKLRGPADKVEAQSKAFKAWIASIEILDESRALPKWETPPGWVPSGRDDIRMALFAIGKPEDGLDCGVSYVPGTLLDNINRWREQVGLPKRGAGDLDHLMEPVMINGRRAFFVDVSGPGGPKKMMGPFHGKQ
ncbi:MAG: hypothetical protein K8T89_03960 [Planctomycetes bacterium]|nr:hypothetical protein [Planctomycetota bacterium]